VKRPETEHALDQALAKADVLRKERDDLLIKLAEWEAKPIVKNLLLAHEALTAAEDLLEDRRSDSREVLAKIKAALIIEAS